MVKYLLVAFAGLSFAGGLVIIWLPIPLGVPLFLISIPILMRYSPRAKNWLLKLGSLDPRIEKFLKRMGKDGNKKNKEL